MAKPRLEVTDRFPNGVPITYRCSECHQNISKNQPPNPNAVDGAFDTVDAAFEAHVKQKHPAL
jgi:hypothetical protein